MNIVSILESYHTLVVAFIFSVDALGGPTLMTTRRHSRRKSILVTPNGDYSA